jgi:tetratricopeptide (TPR) repeat protein
MPSGSRSSWRSVAAATVRRLRSAAPSADAADELVERARRASGERRWDDAVAAWQAALDAEVGSRATALARLGGAQRRAGDVEAAEEVLEAAADEFPDHVAIATERALAAVTARRWDLAVDRWRAVVQLQGDAADARTLGRLARAEVQAGDLEAAATTLDRVRQLTEPAPSAEVLDQLAKVLVQLGARERAGEVLERGVALHPDDLDLHVRWADLADLARDWPTAVQRWEAVLQVGGAGAPARADAQLARAHQHQGDLEAAARAVARGRERHPDDLELGIRWAKLATAARDPEEAHARFTALLELPEPAPSEVHRDRARAAAATDAWDAADEALTTGLEAHPGDPVLLVERAYMAIRRDDWDEVDARWEVAREGAAAPLAPELFTGMARRCAAAFQHERADRVAEQALRTHPGDREVRRQHVRNAISAQRRERAPQDWDWREALRRAREAWEALGPAATADDVLGLATELAEASAIAEARSLLREGHATFPGDHELVRDLAILSAASGDWEEAVHHLRDLALRPDAPFELRSALVRSHLGRGDAAAAAEALDLVAADDPRGLRERALVAAHRGDHAEVVAALQRAVAAAPDDRSRWRHLAVAHRRAGDEDAAVRAVADAHRDGPGLETNPGVVAIVGGGPSLRGIDLTPLRGRVHNVALNATALALPWTDVAVTHDPSHLVERFHGYEQPVIAGLPLGAIRARGTLPGFELRRRLLSDRLSELDDVLHSGGHTSAYTALNYAYLLGARRVVLFGIDLNALPRAEDYWHGSQDRYNRRLFAELESRPTFARWWAYRARKLSGAPDVFASTVAQLDAAGVEVVNASPDSAIACFPKVSPEEGVARCLEGDLGT